MEGAPKKPSRFEKGLRGALAGAAFLGAVGGAEVPKGGGVPQMTAAEAHEAFDANEEADMFIAEIQSLKIGIDDAGGRQTLQAEVESGLDAFALALKTRVPHFSAKGKTHVQGTLSIEDRERAKALIRPKLAIDSTNTLAMRMLKAIVGTKALTPDQLEGIRQMRRDMGNEDTPQPQSKPGVQQSPQMTIPPMGSPQDLMDKALKEQQDMMDKAMQQQRDMLKGLPRLPGQ